MSSMLHPGVYVREARGGSRSIEGAPTSTTIFVGETERGPIGPTRIRGKTEYERLFGGFQRIRGGTESRLLMPHAIGLFFDNGGGQAYVLRAMNDFDSAAAASRPIGGASDLTIEASSPGVWGNSLSVTLAASTDGDPTRFRIVVYYQAPGATTPSRVEDLDRLSADPADESFVIDVLRRSRFIRGTVAAPPLAGMPALDDGSAGPTAAVLLAAAVALAGGSGGDLDLSDNTNPSYADLLDRRLESVDDAALIVAASDRMMPGHATAFDDGGFIGHGNVFVGYVENRPLLDLFFVADLPRITRTFGEQAADQAVLYARGGAPPTPQPTRSEYCGLYWPHVEVGDPVGSGPNATTVIPPSGAVAGLYARTDGRRGVWKAPAGVDATIGGIRSLDFRVLDSHQDNLNPNAVNALRQIPAAGFVSWGARTRRPDGEWRYVPVRRTAIFLRKSIYEGIQWAVFEPNGDELWASLRATIGAFMETQFRNGAFAGTTSREAYFVKCDAETTTDIDQAAGRVNILVGFAPLRPAEFVVVELSQKVNQSA